MREDVIADNRPDFVGRRFLRRSKRRGLSLVLDARLTPLHITRKEPREIEDMQTEHHHVLSACTVAHFADGVNFQKVADESLAQRLLQSPHRGSHACDMRHGDAEMVLLREAHDVIRLRQSDGEGLFEIQMRA